jgi:hypothetical protein
MQRCRPWAGRGDHRFLVKERLVDNQWVGLELLEPRVLLSAGPFTFVDNDGDVYTVRLTGPGDMAVVRDNSHPNNLGPIDAIELIGTDVTSKLIIKVKKKVGDGLVSVRSITAKPIEDAGDLAGTGSLGAILGKRVDLVGDPDSDDGIVLEGSLGHLRLHDIIGAQVLTGPAASAEAPARTRIHARIIDGGAVLIIGTESVDGGGDGPTKFDTNTTLVQLKAALIGPSSIATQNARRILVTGRPADELPGLFGGELDVGDLGRLWVRHAMVGADIRVLRMVGMVNTGLLIDSNIFAGFDADDTVTVGDPQENEIPESSDVFVDKFNAVIKHVKVRGLEGEEFWVINSNIAAWRMGRIDLGFILRSGRQPREPADHPRCRRSPERPPSSRDRDDPQQR